MVINYKGTEFQTLQDCMISLGIADIYQDTENLLTSDNIDSILDSYIQDTLDKCRRLYPDFKETYDGVEYRDIPSYCIRRNISVEVALYKLRRGLPLENASCMDSIIKDFSNFEYEGRTFANLGQFKFYYGLHFHARDFLKSVAKKSFTLQQALTEAFRKAYLNRKGFYIDDISRIPKSLTEMKKYWICEDMGLSVEDVDRYMFKTSVPLEMAVDDLIDMKTWFFYEGQYYSNLEACCNEKGIDMYRVLSLRREAKISINEAISRLLSR